MSEFPDPSSRNIVVVEDEALVRELAVCELEDGGFVVRDFASADEALGHLSLHGADIAVLFTDVQMPGRLNGLDLMDIVSRTWPTIKVLVTSGGPLVNPAALPDCARFVAKPWRAADILRRIRHLTETRAMPCHPANEGFSALLLDGGQEPRPAPIPAERPQLGCLHRPDGIARHHAP